MTKTATMLPSIAELGTTIMIKSCNGQPVTNVVHPPNCKVEFRVDYLPGKWTLIGNTPTSQTYRMDFDE